MEGNKIFNDPIHGHIELHPVCVAIIDTPQFQRLRHISQMGGAYYVYPGATHNRFEHSIGVSHLARKMATVLQRQPELDVTDKDILCVEIAGLCHDMGHGPFSHLFDKRFIPQAYSCHGEEERWKHEDASVLLYEYMRRENPHLAELFSKYDLDEQDHVFIKEQITGPCLPATEQNGHSNHNGRLGSFTSKPKWQFKGRSKEKGFLYDIVSNKRNGVDVDKWDYLARDCARLGVAMSFNHKRLFKYARVMEVDGEKQICFRLKEADNLQDLFISRRVIHRLACQHKVTFIVEQMIAEALLEADPFYRIIRGRDDVPEKISECIKRQHIGTYCELDDSIFQAIVTSRAPQLKKSRDILDRIVRRNFYTFIGETRPKNAQDVSSRDEPKFAEKIAAMDKKGRLKAADLVIQVGLFGFGSKGNIENVYFYEKEELERPCRIHKEKAFIQQPESVVRVYSKKTTEDFVSLVRQCFEAWRMENDMWSFEESHLWTTEEEKLSPRRKSDIRRRKISSFSCF